MRAKAILMLLVFWSLSQHASISIAANIEVTAQIGEPGCDLVEAIHAANVNAPVWGCVANSGSFGDDVIVLNNTVPISEFIISTIDNTIPGGASNGLPVIFSNITILGAGNSLVTIQRDLAETTPDFRLFDIAIGNTLTLENVSIQNGRAPGFAGGGIRVDRNGVLNIVNSQLNSNRASFGGAISSNGEVNINNSFMFYNYAERGGAIDSRKGSTTTLRSSTLALNIAEVAGGGINVGTQSTVALYDSTISQNGEDSPIFNSSGGGINFSGLDTNITITNSTIATNFANRGGGISFNAGSASGFGNSHLSIINSIITTNSAEVPRSGNELRFVTPTTANTLNISYSLLGNSNQTTVDAVQGNFNAATNILATSNGDTPTDAEDILLPLLESGNVAIHGLRPNSPAIDAGTDGTVFQLGFSTMYLPGCRGTKIGDGTILPPYRPDQLGTERPSGSACDIGAVEREQDDSQCYVLKAANGDLVTICL